MSNCQSLLGFLVLVQFTLFRASFHFEFINYFALQGFDLLVDWRQFAEFPKLASHFFKSACNPQCARAVFLQYTFSLLTFGSFRFLSHFSS